MSKRRYYSIRTGKNPLGQGFDLPFLRRLFHESYLELLKDSYFQEALGYECGLEEEPVPGSLGRNIHALLFRTLRKSALWPIEDHCLEYSEDDTFDMIEFLFDHVSQPVDRDYCEYDEVYHYSSFDQQEGQKLFRTMFNTILQDYSTGFELSEEGEILASAEPGLDDLFAASPPAYDPEHVTKRVDAAVLKFRRYRSSLDERRDAVRDLVDVLEFLRPKVKAVLNDKDEDDLFELANRYGIRHHKADQKTTYDKSVWYPWMFYYYLATIHACLRLIEESEAETTE